MYLNERLKKNVKKIYSSINYDKTIHIKNIKVYKIILILSKWHFLKTFHNSQFILYFKCK